MDKIKKLLMLPLLVGIGFSCQSGGEYSRELGQVDSLQMVVEDYRLQLGSLDTARISRISIKVDTQFTFITTNHPDTMDREFWKKDLSYLGLIMKNLNRFEENYPDLKREIHFTAKQLETLENTLRDEKISGEEDLNREKAEDYLYEEAQAVQRIKFQAARFLPETERALTLWDSLEPRFDSISDYVRGLP